MPACLQCLHITGTWATTQALLLSIKIKQEFTLFPVTFPVKKHCNIIHPVFMRSIKLHGVQSCKVLVLVSVITHMPVTGHQDPNVVHVGSVAVPYSYKICFVQCTNQKLHTVLYYCKRLHSTFQQVKSCLNDASMPEKLKILYKYRGYTFQFSVSQKFVLHVCVIVLYCVSLFLSLCLATRSSFNSFLCFHRKAASV